MLVAVLAVAAVALVGYGMHRVRPSVEPAASSAASTALAESADTDRTPTLLVVGDSFAGGTGDPRITTYPGLVAERMGWNLRLDAEGGTGYIASSTGTRRQGRPFIERLPYDAAQFDADYILVDGGRNDLGELPNRTAAAMDRWGEMAGRRPTSANLARASGP